MKSFLSHLIVLSAIGLLTVGCASTSRLSPPSAEAMPLSPRIRPLNEKEVVHWGHLDPVQDSVPGMSVQRAYKELLKNRKGQSVVVAVIDSGIDLKHEDLASRLWMNTGEIAGDGLDNDQNGYVDDVHGYNFLGESYHEQLEFTRIIAKKLGDTSLQEKAQALLDRQVAEAKEGLTQYVQIEKLVSLAHQNLQKKLGKEFYTLEDLQRYSPENEQETQLMGILSQVMGMAHDIPSVLKELKAGINYFKSQMDYNLNLDFDGRKAVGDDPYDLTNLGYGNGNPNNQLEEESHGTHVAGIIGASRTNKKGGKGICIVSIIPAKGTHTAEANYPIFGLYPFSLFPRFTKN